MEKVRKKVLFAAQNLMVGGVQKALVNQLKHDALSDAMDITLFSFNGGIYESDIPQNIKTYFGTRPLELIATPLKDVLRSKKITDIIIRGYYTCLAKIIGSEKVYRWLFKKQRRFDDFDIAISYFTDIPNGSFNKGTNLFVSDYVTATEKIAWLHTDPKLGGLNREYCLKIYKDFNKIVCVSDAVMTKLSDLLPEYKNKMVVKHNVFPEQEIKELAEEYVPFCEPVFHIVTVGRVDNYTKRIDGIVRICKRLLDDGIKGFKWHIVGNGPDLESDIQLAKDLGVIEYIDFAKEKHNPYPYIKNANLFALYSAFEGFPMVIGEAIVLNTKILSVNYAAAREQIDDSHGIIAKDDEDFYAQLKQIVLNRLSANRLNAI